MRDYKYRVTGPKGGKYLTTTRKEAEKLTRHGGSFRALGQKKASKVKNPSFGTPITHPDVAPKIEWYRDRHGRWHGDADHGLAALGHYEIVHATALPGKPWVLSRNGTVVGEEPSLKAMKTVAGWDAAFIAYHGHVPGGAYGKQRNPQLEYMTKGGNHGSVFVQTTVEKAWQGWDEPMHVATPSSGKEREALKQSGYRYDRKRAAWVKPVRRGAGNVTDIGTRNPARKKLHPAIPATIKALRGAGEKPFKSVMQDEGPYWIEFEVFLSTPGIKGGEALYFNYNESNKMLTWHDFSHITEIGKLTSRGFSAATMRRALDSVRPSWGRH